MVASEGYLRPTRRQEPHRRPGVRLASLREAVSRALGATGTTVTSAGLVLAGTFAVFALVGGRGSGGNRRAAGPLASGSASPATPVP